MLFASENVSKTDVPVAYSKSRTVLTNVPSEVMYKREKVKTVRSTNGVFGLRQVYAEMYGSLTNQPIRHVLHAYLFPTTPLEDPEVSK